MPFHLELLFQDYAFLSSSFGDMDYEEFVALLRIAETIVDYVESGTQLPVCHAKFFILRAMFIVTQ